MRNGVRLATRTGINTGEVVHGKTRIWLVTGHADDPTDADAATCGCEPAADFPGGGAVEGAFPGDVLVVRAAAGGEEGERDERCGEEAAVRHGRTLRDRP